MGPKFTYIIPFYYRQDRVMPLRRVVDWLSGFSGIEILIVEQGKHSKISELNLKAKSVFLQSDIPFNKSWSINYGLKIAKSNIIVCGSSDVIMNPNDLIESLKVLENYDCVIPTSGINFLNHGESMMDMNSILSVNKPQPKTIMSYDISLFKRDSLLRIGGWNEDLTCGGEDVFQDYKINRLHKFIKLNYNSFKLSTQPQRVDENLKKRDEHILSQIMDGDMNKLHQHISSYIFRLGSKAKCI